MNILRQIKERLALADVKSTFVHVRHLPELRRDFERLLAEKALNRKFYDEIVARYGLTWHFQLPADFQTAETVIITAVPQPKTSLQYEFQGKKYYGTIPPTYVNDTDKMILDILAPMLAQHGYTVHDALLPSKLLAVRSGLARYGRNNITYIDGWGSYFRLRAFFTDAPCSDEDWQESAALELCNGCTACAKKCPTGAIRTDRFLLEAGRCLTFFNEGEDEFPEWIDPAWHNCLIGCMICQDVCPANREHVAWIIPGGDFSEKETTMMLDGVAQDELPPDTVQKLQKVCMLNEYPLLGRNLHALIDKERKSSGGVKS